LDPLEEPPLEEPPLEEPPLEEPDEALPLLAGAVSVLAGPSLREVSDFPSPPALPLEVADGDPLEVPADAGRLSVTYQPDPLNTIPAGKSTRRTRPPHSGHSVTGGSEKR
jgi:hypothetical protein